MENREKESAKARAFLWLLAGGCIFGGPAALAGGHLVLAGFMFVLAVAALAAAGWAEWQWRKGRVGK